MPSREGLILNLETSLLFQLDPGRAADIYRTVGSNYVGTIVEPQFRSAIREVTASYDAKALYSAERDRIANEIMALFSRIAGGRGIVVQQVLLRKIGLPPVVANAIQEKLRREQEAEQMKFVVQKEQQEAERKRIEAQGIADFQRIVAQGISAQLLSGKASRRPRSSRRARTRRSSSSATRRRGSRLSSAEPTGKFPSARRPPPEAEQARPLRRPGNLDGPRHRPGSGRGTCRAAPTS